MSEMTNTPEILPIVKALRGEWRTVLLLAFDGMGMLDHSGPLAVLWSASRFMEQAGRPGYVMHTVSPGGRTITTAEGLRISTEPASRFAHAVIDTIIVPGAVDMMPVLTSPSLAKWLRSTAPAARRTASVCGGAFLLAEAGLLDGRRATTHWASCELLGARYPSVQVDPQSIFVNDGAVWTSAGVSAGIDLALALVQEDCGREISMKVARELVIYLKRPGGQAQFSELLRVQSSDSAIFEKFHQWLSLHLGDERITVEMMASQVHMSPRNFARSYKAATGRTPAKALELLRVEAARRLLEDSEHGIQQIADRCGFGDEERMRVTFQRHLSISPRDYRKHFSPRR
jgi:transcriptional regulator GlxA family with amidase domain